MSRFAKLILSLLCLALAACQAAGPEDVLGSPKTLVPAPAQEVLGSGPVGITLLVARNAADISARNRAHDIYDGASLALRELGADKVRLTVVEASGGADAARASAEQAIASGSKLVVSGLDGAATSAIAGSPSVSKLPVIDLVSARSGGKGVYAFASDEVSSALEGVRIAVTAKQASVVVAVPEAAGAQTVDRIKAGIRGNGAALTEVVTYPAVTAAIPAALAARRAAFEKATVLVVLGSDNAPARVARAVATGGYGGNITALIGTSAWSRDMFADPVLDGTMIAMIDQESLTELNVRFSATAGRPLSLDAAFAFDAIALAAGLVRAGGNDALGSGAFKSDLWYAGATGDFRFDSQGNVDRSLVLYRIQKGRLVRIADGGN